MAQLYVYHRKSDGHKEAIGGDCDARPPADYDRFPVSRSELSDRNANDVYRVDGGQLVLKPTVSLAADKPSIVADGVDQAVVSVGVAGVDPLPASITIQVADPAGSGTEAVALANGQGSVSPITADSPCEIIIRAADLNAYNDDGGVTIKAE